MTEAPSPTIQLQFQLTPQDYVRANWDYYRSIRVMWIVFIWGGPCMFAAGIYRFFDEPGHPLTFPLFLGAFMLIFMPYSMIVLPRTAFKKQPTLSAPQTFAVGPEGITVDSPLFRGSDAWAMYANFSESKHLFMLYLSTRMFRVIPKRAFTSTEQMEEFRRLIAQHIPPRQKRWVP
jgi:hypothetical protein